ncbi:NUMOD1 domain-containing protein [Apibacter mensalis]|uniref:NUMOD1 domain-containing protein n=1 Tax=Apibacter mensalis TaxID=1586267 RepID=A0A0X3ANR4_9FLAO|nr:NUMOD4 domain-containing protein [Apibacter mensalis]CVK15991.1 NUMOD1 domain-containing protein [Apibacter mensalis]
MQQNHKYPYQNMNLTDMEGEIWKDIPDFEGYYQISNLGRVKSLARELNFYREGTKRVRRFVKTDKIIKQYTPKNHINRFTGKPSYHLTCSIKTELVTHRGSVARLVYRTFVKDVNKFKERVVVAHRDEDPFNNEVSNLYIQTFKELNIRNIKAGRLTPPKINELPKETYAKIYKGRLIPIAQYILTGELIATYPSITHAAKKYGISSGNLNNALNRPNRTCKGFIWKKLPTDGTENEMLSD